MRIGADDAIRGKTVRFAVLASCSGMLLATYNAGIGGPRL
jgi:hypothetical protein